MAKFVGGTPTKASKFVGGDVNKGKYLIINELPLLASPPTTYFWKADYYKSIFTRY